MTTTMNLIAKQTVGAGGAASVTFSSIPQTFTDLKIVTSIRGTSNLYQTQGVRVTFNNSTSGYTTITLLNIGANTAISGTNPYTTNASVSILANNNASTSNTFNNAEIYIPNYAGSNNKSFSSDTVSEMNGNDGYDIQSGIAAGLLSNTAAITSITLTAQSGEGDFAEFSEFCLYGISNSSTQNQTTPSAIGGDSILQIGSYWYHAFTGSGSFVPLKQLSCDVLVVGAGGGGGFYYGGGGGGGAIEGSSFFQTQTLTPSSYAVTIGAGGTGSNSSSVRGGNGGNSIFTGASTITALGGGGGGSGSTGFQTGSAGGSGGGASWGSGGFAGGSASGSNTNAGGTGTSNYATQGARGGGGGGATAAGATGPTSGNGGQGATLTTIDSNLTAANFTLFSGMTVISSGGGASTENPAAGPAGTGGTGAGNGGNVYAPTFEPGGAGVSFGSGGGAGANGGNGARGIVIVRYAV
jgi:hypothetical protein